MTKKFNGKCGFIDVQGRETIPLTYDYTGSFSEELAMICKRGDYDSLNCGFINRECREIIPLKYDDAHSFQQERAAVKLKDRWGFIDKNGKAITPFVYEYVSDFSDGVARVHRNSKAYGYIDRNGVEYFEEDKEKQNVVPLTADAIFNFISCGCGSGRR